MSSLLVENILVSFNFKNNDNSNIYSLDLYLPVFMDLEKLKEELIETLVNMDSRHFKIGDDLVLKCQHREIKSGNLASNGIWDGSDIDCYIQR